MLYTANSRSVLTEAWSLTNFSEIQRHTRPSHQREASENQCKSKWASTIRNTNPQWASNSQSYHKRSNQKNPWDWRQQEPLRVLQAIRSRIESSLNSSTKTTLGSSSSFLTETSQRNPKVTSWCSQSWNESSGLDLEGQAEGERREDDLNVLPWNRKYLGDLRRQTLEISFVAGKSGERQEKKWPFRISDRSASPFLVFIEAASLKFEYRIWNFSFCFQFYSNFCLAPTKLI